MSLAAQLAELSRPAPKPLTRDVLASDDEGARSAGSDDDDGEASDDGGRAAPNRDHYETVARSQRRRAALDETGTLRSAKYRGQTVSARKALGGDDSDEASGDESGEGSSAEIDGEEDDEEEDADDDEEDSDAAPPRAPSPPSRVKSLRFADPSSSSDVAADPRTLAGAAAADAQLLASLRAQSADDAERGRAVQELRVQWEGALAMRIRTQAFVRGAGRIRVSCRRLDSWNCILMRWIQPNALQDLSGLDDAAQTAHTELLGTLSELEQGLFATRQSLISADEEPELAEAYAGAERKRKRAASADADEAHLARVDSFLALHDATSERACAVLDAWSVGPQAVGGGAKELRAVNRGAGEQVRTAMSGDSAGRLLRRARIWRGEVRVGEEEQQRAQQQADEADPEVFDDSDFYATLLRELIESKGEASGGAGEWDDAPRCATAADATAALLADPSLGLPVRSKAPKRAVDTRASKGRRLRCVKPMRFSAAHADLII